MIEGEPETYSATIIRTIDDGSTRQEIITRIARSAEMRREEWSEQGRLRALISRPDLSKMFLLDFDEQSYIEFAFGSVPASGVKSNSSNPKISAASEAGGSFATNAEELERALDETPAPASVMTRTLAGQTIENHPCKVFERRASFSDGHVEISRVFRAVDLQGLAIRIETESEGGVRIITERRDVKVEVSPEEFVVPPAFKKVAKLNR